MVEGVRSQGTGSGRRRGRLRENPLAGGLGRRLLAWFLLLALLPLLGSNTLGYMRSQGIIEGLVQRYLTSVARVQALHIRDRVDRYVSYLQAVATGNEFLAAGVRRARGQIATPMDEVATTEAVNGYLRRQREELGAFDALVLVSPEGRVVASSGAPPAELRDPGAPVGAGRRVDALRVRPGGPPRFRFAAPVTSEARSPAGYLVGVVGPGRAREFLEIPEHLPGSIESFLLDMEGRPLFVSHVHGSVDYTRPLETPVLRLPAGAHARYVDRMGVEVVGIREPVPDHPWIYVAEVPVTDALGELRALREASVLLGLLFAGVVVGAAWFVSAGIVAPVRRLVEAARRLGKGDLRVRVPVSGEDEIGELGRAFNEMAEELARSTAEIEELHRREIERAQQLATVGELASGVAHEIKNPVMGLSGGMDLIRRRIGGDDQLAPIMEEMERELRRIDAAVRDLLAFARPATPELAPTSPNEVAERAARLVQPGADRARVALELALDPAVPEIWLDPELVRQALVNLMVNAVQATPAGGRVRVATGVRDGEVVIAVEDTGRGIPEEVRDQIFKPFFTTRHSGTGLGLSITREIVERHGGRIEVSSRVGEGSAFTVILPVGARPGDCGEGPGPRGEGAGPGGGAGSGGEPGRGGGP